MSQILLWYDPLISYLFYAYEQVARAFNRKQLSEQWSQDRMMYAAFYESYVVRGSYKTDGQVCLQYIAVRVQ